MVEHWYLDPVNGNDAKSGREDPRQAVKTWRQMRKLMGPILSVDTVVHLLSDGAAITDDLPPTREGVRFTLTDEDVYKLTGRLPRMTYKHPGDGQRGRVLSKKRKRQGGR